MANVILHNWKNLSYFVVLRLQSVKKTIPFKKKNGENENYVKTHSEDSDTKLQWDGANFLKPYNVTVISSAIPTCELQNLFSSCQKP